MAEKVVKIGCSAGFWGDSVTGAFQLINKAEGLNYLVADYLAEMTMGLLARMKAQGGARGGMGEGGYVSEFVYSVWKPLMKKIMEKNIKIVCNAGGMNPTACKEEIERLAQEAGIEVKVAAIVGDDLMERAGELKEKGLLKAFKVEGMEEPLLPENKVCLSFNAYIGARPIAYALAQGAQIVITGRCTDSAMVLGPLMHEFQWTERDYDLLAAGSLGGHIIECGCQCTGGNFTDWRRSCFSPHGGWTNIGFPILEFSPDGSFVVTKPPSTGGLVSFGSVAEQIVYEIHDPSEYILPDVILDFRGVKLTENYGGEDRVRVTGARGYPPTEYYKVSGTFFDGYSLSAELLISGFEAKEKAIEVGKAIIERSRQLLKSKSMSDFIATNIETLGAEQTYGESASAVTREIVLRISAHHEKVEGLKVFGKELAPSATGMAPGITGAGARPHPAPLILHYSSLIPKPLVPISVFLSSLPPFTSLYPSPSPSPSPSLPLGSPPPPSPSSSIAGEFALQAGEGEVEVPLIALCYGRSGDKGDVANIGLIARDPRFYPLLKAKVTAEVVHRHFLHYVQGSTTRYELPGLHALNFVLTKSLGGGGLGSLRIDKQGKSYAQILLTLSISLPKSFLPLSSL